MAQADEIMAGDEMNVAIWGLINSFLELVKNYEITQRVETKNYSDYLIYEFFSLWGELLIFELFIGLTK